MGPVPSLVINVKKKGGLDKSSPYNKLNPYNKLTPYKQGGFDESNPYKKSIPHKIWKYGDRPILFILLRYNNGDRPHFIDRKYLHGIDIPTIFLDSQ